MFAHSLPHWSLKISSLFIFLLFSLTMPYGYAASKSFTCYVQANKDPAWSAYDVKLSMYDINTQKIFETFSLPQAKGNVPSVNSIKKAFDCQNHSLVSFLASY